MMQYYQLFVDAWRLFRKLSQMAEDADPFWDQMVGETCELAKRYGDRPFAVEIMCAIANELERIAKTRRHE